MLWCLLGVSVFTFKILTDSQFVANFPNNNYKPTEISASHFQPLQVRVMK